MQVVMMTMDELQAYSSNLVNSTIASLPKPENNNRYPEFLTRSQAAEFLGGISLPSLDKLVKERKLIVRHPTPDRSVFWIEDLRSHLLIQKSR